MQPGANGSMRYGSVYSWLLLVVTGGYLRGISWVPCLNVFLWITSNVG